MSWYMGLKNNVVVGWSVTPVVGYIEVPQAVRDTHELNPEFTWDGVGLVAPILPAPYIQPPEEIESQRIAQLWQAAHDYEYKEISGSAVGLLAMGVMQAKPKCIDVQNWIKGIWAEYYTRKANGSTDYDYSICGVCPYSVPELMIELGL